MGLQVQAVRQTYWLKMKIKVSQSYLEDKKKVNGKIKWLNGKWLHLLFNALYSVAAPHSHSHQWC